MTMFDGRRHRRSRTELTVRIKGMASFVNAPAIIFTTPDEVSGFPEILAVVAHPDLPGFLINAHAPRIAQTVSPVFRSRVFQSDKGIVVGYRVRLRSVRVININAQHATEKFA